MEHEGPFRGRRRDRCLRYLDTAQIGQAGCAGARQRDGCFARAQSGQSRYAADHRARHSDRHCRSCHVNLHVADRVAPRVFREYERTRCACRDTDNWRRGLHRVDELLRLGGNWLYGGPDWFVQQPALWHWNFGSDWRGVAARDRRKTVRIAGCWQVAHGVCPFHDRGDFLRCRNRQQQPSGPQDRPIGRRDTVEATSGFGNRRYRRCDRDSAGAQSSESCLQLRRRAGRGTASASAAGASSRPDLVAGSRRDYW